MDVDDFATREVSHGIEPLFPEQWENYSVGNEQKKKKNEKKVLNVTRRRRFVGNFRD